MTPYRARPPVRRSTDPAAARGLFALLVAGGFGAIVTGIFGLGSELIKQPTAQETQVCAIAAQVVLDETPNPYMTTATARQIAARSAEQLARCLKGSSDDGLLAVTDLSRRHDGGVRPAAASRTAP